MFNNKKPKVVIKKVQAYPFPMNAIAGSQPIQGQILKLTPHGFLSSMKSVALILGYSYDVSFMLPATNIQISVKAKVIKAYDRKLKSSTPAPAGEEGSEPTHSTAKPPLKNLTTERILEMHFINMPPEFQTAINSFLKKINQAE